MISSNPKENISFSFYSQRKYYLTRENPKISQVCCCCFRTVKGIMEAEEFDLRKWNDALVCSDFLLLCEKQLSDFDLVGDFRCKV